MINMQAKLNGKKGLIATILTMALLIGAYQAAYYTWTVSYSIEPLTVSFKIDHIPLSGATFGDVEVEMEELHLVKSCDVHFMVTAMETEKLAENFYDLQVVLGVVDESYILGAVELDLVKEGVAQGEIDEAVFLWGEDYFVYGWVEYWTGALTETVTDSVTVNVYAVEAVEPDVIEVHAGGSIQDAVDAASTGDWIIVKYDTYEENVVVDKSVTLFAPEGATVDAGGETVEGNGFLILADDVKIIGFEIYDAVGYQEAGIFLGSIDVKGVSGCLIAMNDVWDCSNGIYLWDSDNNFIVDNWIYECTDVFEGVGQTIFGNGIILWDGGKDNKIVCNEIIDCDRWGIFLGADTTVDMSGNKVHDNYLEGNGYYSWIDPGDWNWLGIGVMNAQGPITITDNYITINAGNTECAIWLEQSTKVYCRGNEIVET